MDTLLNGVGPFAALSAIPMLIGLLVRESVWAVRLRRLGILIAVLLPVAFLILAAGVYAPNGTNTPFDFKVNYQAAHDMYGQNGSPYNIEAAYSFPFPTFYLYWLASGFGRLNEVSAWIVWWIINIILWIACVILIFRALPRMTSVRGNDAMRYAAVAIPAFTTIWQGQTALFVLAGLVALHYALRNMTDRKWLIVGGIGLAFAILIKPQVLLVTSGLLIFALRGYYENRRDNMQHMFWILGSAVVTAVVLILLTLLLPGGVTLDTYRSFAEVLSQVARPEDNITVIGSPSFVGSYIALRLGLPEPIADTISNLITLLVIIAAVIWTLRREDRPLTEIAAGWAVWAMIAPRVSWTWYATWCLPYFLLAVQDVVRQRGSTKRLALFVLVLALLNLQVPFIPAAFLTIALLTRQLWTSFRPSTSSALSV